MHLLSCLRHLAATTITGALFVACSAGDATPSSADSQAAHVRDVVAAGGVVDSVLPIAEQLRRFRADVPERPDTLRHASASIDTLVQRWGRAIALRDSAALNAMTLAASLGTDSRQLR